MLALVAVVLLVAVAGIVAYNLIGSEKRIERRLDRLYGLADSQFTRELGVLLGPPRVAGRDPRRQQDHQFRVLYLLVGRYRQRVRASPCRARQGGRQGTGPAGC